MNFNWMFKFLSVSSMTTHNSSHSWQNLTLTTNFYSILQFIPRLTVPFPPLSPPAQQPGQWHRAQLCWLDLRPVLDLASSVSAHYYIWGENKTPSLDQCVANCPVLWYWGGINLLNVLLLKLKKLCGGCIIWHFRSTIMQSQFWRHWALWTAHHRPLYFYNKTK